MSTGTLLFGAATVTYSETEDFIQSSAVLMTIGHKQTLVLAHSSPLSHTRDHKLTMRIQLFIFVPENSDQYPLYSYVKSCWSTWVAGKCLPSIYPSIYLRVYSLHHNVLPTLQSIPLMTNGPLYPITQDSSCHGQHTMPRNPWSFPWPVPHSCVCMNVCVLQWRKVCVVIL